MVSIRQPQNPGLGGLDELTSAEELTIQQIAGLGDPNADRILFWDDSAGQFEYLTAGTGLTITGTTITATTGGVAGTINEIAYFDSSSSITSLAVATYPSLTELSYVKGLTSSAQTQITAKMTNPMTTGGDVIYGGASGVPTRLANGSAGQVLQSNGTTLAPTWVAAGAGDMILASVQSVTGLKTFDTTKLAVKGSSTGSTAIASANAGASNYTQTLQAQTGTIANSADVHYIGTTSVALNRASAALVLTGITSIDGNAATVTNGVYTTGAGSVYAVGSTGLAGGQTIAGSTLTAENLTLRANAADLTTGAVIVSSSKEASSATVGSVQLAGGLAVAKRVYALDMTVTNTITGTTSGNLVSGGALGTPSSGTGTNITGIPAANILAGSFGAGAYVISTSLQSATIELGHATDTTLSRSAAGVLAVEGVVIPSISSTNTLTNKRITKRSVSVTSTTTSVTINSDTTDIHVTTAQAGALLYNNPSGTPTEGQTLWIAVTGTAARALTWDTNFEASAAVALPTTTVTTARLDVGFVWRVDTSKWHCIASA